MRDLIAFLLGSVRVRFLSGRPERIINALRRLNCPLWGLAAKEGEVSFSLLYPRRGVLLSFRENLSDGERLILTEKGLPALLFRYRKRWGFFAGLAIFIAATILSTRVVWSVEVSGAAAEAETVAEGLRQADLYPGRHIAGLDTDRVSRLFLLAHPEFSYAGIRLSGTRALVELRAADKVEKKDPFEGTSNLIATSSGRVVRCEVAAGEILVKPGDLVKRGDLLVSGIRARENGAFRPVRSRGRVFCETEDVLEIFVPFAERETVFTGREKVRRSYYCLGARVFSTGEKDPFSASEAQRDLSPVTLFGRDTPILCRTVCFSETAEKMTRRTVDIARNMAYDKYMEYKWKLMDADGQILSETLSEEEREDGFFLQVRLTSVRDLAGEAPFSLVPDGSSKR
ncbi:MAG: sporulation protein YqfD [Clostridia bacterium]|nr:sporulation protein YqfD [Clostridia bacterium]